MPSTFAWLDYSENERRRALDVISLFKQRETRDELGIASVRDAFAEMFFPGTSTIQTRAKYFLLIPWMYLDFERRAVGSHRIEDRARWVELRLIDTLAESGDSYGVIGIESRKGLQRVPSNIYWAGLRRWGILLHSGSQSQYHRHLDGFYERVRQHRKLSKEAEGVEVEPSNWHSHVPAPPDEFPDEASLELTPEEGDYLRERVRSTCQGSLLAWLVDLDESWSEVDFAWQHPEIGAFPQQLVDRLEHARKFSEVMHGAALLYNFMLAEALAHEEWIAKFESEFVTWADQVDEQADEIRAWQGEEFWDAVYTQSPRIPLPTRRFVDRWIAVVKRADPPQALRDNREARQLISHREARLKAGRARLQNRRRLELWNGSSGSGRLDFRWPISQTIVLDILERLV